MTDEAELLQHLRNREKNSIDEAIQIYTPYLSTVLYHMAGNSLPKEDIEEIVADVFVVLWKNAERIDLQKGTLRSYLAAVAATGKISMWTGSSASRADYTSLPAVEQVTKDIGYSPVLIDTFENGYCFKKGNIIKNSFKDGNANVIEKFKSVSFDYQKNGDVVSFEQQKYNSKLIPSGDIIATVNGTNLYYVHYINKVVSDDYELTEQDKKDQASGKVVFSYDDSASQIEVSQVQSVNWNKDGIQYDLLQIDGQLSAGELADMAREVINNRR